MPQLGPAFLHRPLPSLPAISLGEAWSWFVEGLFLLAPARLRRAGWRPDYQLVETGDDGSRHATLVERAWSGERRIAASPPDKTLPKVIALAPNQIFETRIALPALARGAVREAVRLRLDELSPVPPENVLFDIGPVRRLSPDRIEASVAIAKRQNIAALAGEFGSAPAIGASPRSDGSLRYMFESVRAHKGEWRMLAAISAPVIAAMLLIAGMAHHLDKKIASSEQYEALLLGELKAIKLKTAWIATDAPASVTSDGPAAAKAIAGLADKLPGGVVIERASFADGSWSVEGYAPDKTTWPQGATPSLSRSDRPAFQKFDITFPADASS